MKIGVTGFLVAALVGALAIACASDSQVQPLLPDGRPALIFFYTQN